MKKSTKGAVAAAAAGVLLLGGAGSLAYWTAEETVNGGDITAGELKLTDGECDDDWLHDGGPSDEEVVALFVPGDTVTKECTFVITATGDNLDAEFEAPSTVDITTTPYVDLSATVETSYAIAGTALADGATITDANDGNTVTVTFDVTIDFGTADVPAVGVDPAVPGVNGNATQDITAALDDLTVTLTQLDASPPALP